MGSQPDLASRSEVDKWCRFTHAFAKMLFPKKGNNSTTKIIQAPKTLNLDPLFGTFTLHRISPERNVSSTNQNANVNLQCVPTSWPTFRDLWPRNGWDPFAYWRTLKNSVFRHCRASHTKATKYMPPKFFQMLEGLRDILFTVKFWENLPQKFRPSLCWIFWPPLQEVMKIL